MTRVSEVELAPLWCPLFHFDCVSDSLFALICELLVVFFEVIQFRMRFLE